MLRVEQARACEGGGATGGAWERTHLAERSRARGLLSLRAGRQRCADEVDGLRGRGREGEAQLLKRYRGRVEARSKGEEEDEKRGASKRARRRDEKVSAREGGERGRESETRRRACVRSAFEPGSGEGRNRVRVRPLNGPSAAPFCPPYRPRPLPLPSPALLPAVTPPPSAPSPCQSLPRPSPAAERDRVVALSLSSSPISAPPPSRTSTRPSERKQGRWVPRWTVWDYGGGQSGRQGAGRGAGSRRDGPPFEGDGSRGRPRARGPRGELSRTGSAMTAAGRGTRVQQHEVPPLVRPLADPPSLSPRTAPLAGPAFACVPLFLSLSLSLCSCHADAHPTDRTLPPRPSLPPTRPTSSAPVSRPRPSPHQPASSFGLRQRDDALSPTRRPGGASRPSARLVDSTTLGVAHPDRRLV